MRWKSLRGPFLKAIGFVSFFGFVSNYGYGDSAKPNLVLIIVDDLNDWIGCMDEYPGVKTPNIDRLADQGVLFSNAHVQGAFCAPSRVSFLSGLYPWTTGSYEFEPRYDENEALEGVLPFPMLLRESGYETYGGGKIFHTGMGQGWVQGCWDHLLGDPKNPSPSSPFHWPKLPIWDWGAWPETEEELGDFQIARAAGEILSRESDKPLLVTVGIRRPHVPLHVPQKWFDLYPVEEIRIPLSPTKDMIDLPHPEIGYENHLAPTPFQLAERELEPSLIQAYLASISFVDHCVGEIMNGIEKGPNKDNTLIVLFSDHGFHLGEKQHWAKRTLWEETTRVPLIIAGTGVVEGGECLKPVELTDIYPLLCDVTAIEPSHELDGQSIRRFLEDPNQTRERPALSTFRPGEYGVRSEYWRYIRYRDGSEELYDHRVDPNEWMNLADEPELEWVLDEHRKWLPRN